MAPGRGEHFGRVPEGERLGDPFPATADPSDYVPREATESVLEALEDALKATEAPLALTGPPRLGKTLLARVLALRLEPSFQTVHLTYPALPPEPLCAWALQMLGEKPGENPEAALLERARRGAEDGRPLLLVVDEGGALPVPTARGLADLALVSGGALRLLVVASDRQGVPGVLAALGPNLEEVRFTDPMSECETAGYVRARLVRVGVPPSLRAYFDSAGLERLHLESCGVPGLLHRLADRVILRGRCLEAGLSAPCSARPRAREPRLELAGGTLEGPPLEGRDLPGPEGRDSGGRGIAAPPAAHRGTSEGRRLRQRLDALLRILVLIALLALLAGMLTGLAWSASLDEARSSRGAAVSQSEEPQHRHAGPTEDNERGGGRCGDQGELDVVEHRTELVPSLIVELNLDLAGLGHVEDADEALEGVSLFPRDRSGEEIADRYVHDVRSRCRPPGEDRRGSRQPELQAVRARIDGENRARQCPGVERRAVEIDALSGLAEATDPEVSVGHEVHRAVGHGPLGEGVVVDAASAARSIAESGLGVEALLEDRRCRSPEGGHGHDDRESQEGAEQTGRAAAL